MTQINVLPEYRRHLVAAALLAAQFDRSAYGCRLYGCWCAQDLKANEFWEAMGFTAIAFRTGSRNKGKRVGDVRRESNAGASSALTPHASRPSPSPRTHIFWQKRIRPNDTTTPWWYPAKTEGGEMREDRLVFPIPPGVNWRDVLPIVLPESANQSLEHTAPSPNPLPAEKKKPKAPTKPAGPVAGLWFGGSPGPTADEIAARAEARAVAKAAAKEAAAKVDPRLVALSRELRDRWSETAEYLLSSPGKYNLCRLTDGTVRRAAVSLDVLPIDRPARQLAA